MVSIGYNTYLGMKIPFLDYGQGSGYIPIEKKTIAIGGFVGTGAAASAWNALSTTGKVVVGAGLGAGGYAAYDWLFGKKAAPIQNPVTNQNPTQPVIVQPVVTQPSNPQNFQYDYSNTWNSIANSPGASIGNEKKMGLNAPFSPSQYVPFAISPQQTTSAKQDTSASQGIDWATLAAIAGVALVAYGYTSRKEK